MSCLFNSIGKLLKRKNVRNEICDYIDNHLDEKISGETIKNWIKYAGLEMNLNARQYMTKMRKSSSWGGGPELMIASKLYNVKIMIGKIVFNCSNNPKRILYLNYNGTHYTPQKIENIV